MVVEVVAVWEKVYAVVVKMEMVWVDGVFTGTLALLTKQRFVDKPMLLFCHHSEEAQSVGYIQVLLHFYP